MADAHSLEAGRQLRHSLRTPLNHVIGYGEMLLEDLEETAEPSLASKIRGVVSEAKKLVTGIEHLGLRLDELTTAAPAALQEDLTRMCAAMDELAILSHGAATLPATDPPAANDDSLNLKAGSGGRIMVVDDNAGNRDILRRHLTRQGHAATMAENGQQALSLLESGNYDLVLLDMLMPVMNGLEVLQRIQSTPSLQGTPVIVISALDEGDSVVRCIQMGAEDYLMKPFDAVLLSARIGVALEKKRLRDEERRRTNELKAALDDLKRTQDQLVVQEKLASLGSLTAGIAHEIKNPLNFVINFADLSREVARQIGDLGLNEERLPALLAQLNQNLAKIEEHGERADRIVKGMLMHSRGKSGVREWIDLNQVVKDAAHLAYHGMRAADRRFNVKLEIDCDPAIDRVKAIPQDLNRVFLNVINNACYAANERKTVAGGNFQPTVKLTTRNFEAGVEVRIRDNGVGIPPAVLEKMFNPFFTTKPAGSGTGLGLSISQDIVVRGHRGTIQAASEEGEFTEILIRLPRESV